MVSSVIIHDYCSKRQISMTRVKNNIPCVYIATLGSYKMMHAKFLWLWGLQIIIGLCKM